MGMRWACQAGKRKRSAGALTIEGEASEADGHDHGKGDTEMVPVRSVVAGPDGPDALTAREEGPAEHKGPVAVAAVHCSAALLQPLQTPILPYHSDKHQGYLW